MKWKPTNEAQGVTPEVKCGDPGGLVFDEGGHPTGTSGLKRIAR